VIVSFEREGVAQKFMHIWIFLVKYYQFVLPGDFYKALPTEKWVKTDLHKSGRNL
jgi:hypothetical protein